MIQVGILFVIDNLTMLIECVLFFLFAGMFLHRRLRSAACFIPAAVISYEQILSQIWGRGYTKAGHKLLWNHVYTLRREIEAATGSSEYIRTEKDYGYRFLPPCSA